MLSRSPTLTSLTVSSRVTLRTGTLVLIRSGVDTCASIQAWLVSATVVQIWEEEQKKERYINKKGAQFVWTQQPLLQQAQLK